MYERKDAKMRILLVEDDASIVKNLAEFLTVEGFEIEYCDGRQSAMDLLERHRFDLALLDISLKEGNGYPLCMSIKEKYDMPVIFVSAMGDEHSVVAGFDMGADDYISKPFSISETVLRIKAVLRRAENAPAKEAEQDVIRYKGLVIDIVKKQVFIDNELVQLTKKEFELLALFVSNQGKVFSRDEILEKIWKNESYVLDRTVDVNITRLRKKIGEYGKYIITRMGYGYYFDAN